MSSTVEALKNGRLLFIFSVTRKYGSSRKDSLMMVVAAIYYCKHFSISALKLFSTRLNVK
jgi:hypothetical protein